MAQFFGDDADADDSDSDWEILSSNSEGPTPPTPDPGPSHSRVRSRSPSRTRGPNRPRPSASESGGRYNVQRDHQNQNPPQTTNRPPAMAAMTLNPPGNDSVHHSHQSGRRSYETRTITVRSSVPPNDAIASIVVVLCPDGPCRARGLHSMSGSMPMHSIAATTTSADDALAMATARTLSVSSTRESTTLTTSTSAELGPGIRVIL